MSTVGQDPNPYTSPVTVDEMAAFPVAGTVLATRGERFLGALLDGLLLMPIVIPISFAMGMAIVLLGLDMNSPMTSVISSLLGGLAGAAAFIGINGYLLANRGQTVGKMIMKTMIVSEATGDKVPLGQLIMLRYVPIWVLSSLPWIGMFISIANGAAIFRGNRKCLHDDFAGTKVVKVQ